MPEFDNLIVELQFVIFLTFTFCSFHLIVAVFISSVLDTDPSGLKVLADVLIKIQKKPVEKFLHVTDFLHIYHVEKFST